MPAPAATNQPVNGAPGRTRSGPTWLTPQLTARSAARAKDTYLVSRFAQLRGRRGCPRLCSFKRISQFCDQIAEVFYRDIERRVGRAIAEVRHGTSVRLTA